MGTTAINWEGYRSQSTSIRDFVEKLTAGAKELPPELRAPEYYKVLKDIDPDLPAVVERRVVLETAKGTDPAVAMKAAVTEALTMRRRRIFGYVFGKMARERADTVVNGVMRSYRTPAERAVAYHNIIRLFRPPMTPGYHKEDAELRLRETGFDEWFIRWALDERKPVTPKQIQAKVKIWISQGTDPKEAMRKGVELAVREYALDQLMSLGVASGPDFCIAATVVAAASAAIAVAGLIYTGVSASNAEDAAKDSARRMRNTPLDRSEIQGAVDLSREEADWERAKQIFSDFLMTHRGRTRPVGEEEATFRELWQAARGEIFTAQAEAQLASRSSALRQQTDSYLASLEQQVAAREAAQVQTVQAQRTRTRWTAGGIALGLAVLGGGLVLLRR